MDLYEIIKGRDFSIYGTSEFIKEVIEENEIRLSDEEYSTDILEYEDHVILSKCGNDNGVWIVEEMLNEYGNQIYNETDVAIIQEEILEMVDVEEIVAEDILIISVDEEEIPEIVEEILDEVLEGLEDGEECPHCIIKEALLEAYSIGKKDGLLNAMDRIEELL